MDVIYRDLGSYPPIWTDQAFAEASLTKTEQRTRAQTQTLELSEVLINEIERSHVLVIDTPIYNFTLPASLKAWIDLVVRPGRTFQIKPSGKVGLLRNRPVYVLVAAGGPIGDARSTQADFLTPYLRYVLQIIGLYETSFLLMESMCRGPEAIRASQVAADNWIEIQINAVVGKLPLS